MSADLLTVRLRQIRLEAEGILSFEFTGADGGPLPAVQAGAHIDLHLPGRMRRSYSLCNRPGSTSWQIAVQRDDAGRGASRWLHDQARVGQHLQVTSPSNDFPLDEEAAFTLFITGGIGLTPVLPMMERLTSLGRPWRLHHAVRNRSRLAFGERLAALGGGAGAEVEVHVGHEQGARMDLAALVSAAPADAHIYVCGPNGLIDAVQAAAAPRGPAHCHAERFAAAQAAAVEGGYQIQLASDGRVLEVPPGRSILDVLLDHGVEIAYSCMQGICGSCRVGVKSGLPDHRDEWLSDDERAAGDAMMVCCSGSRSSRLVLDL